MATTITLYASPTGPFALATVDTAPNVRNAYDFASATSGAVMNAVPVNATVCLRGSVAEVTSMVTDHADKVDRLVSLLAADGTQYQLDAVVYTVKAGTNLDGGVVLTKALPQGSFTIRPLVLAVQFQDIMNIKDLAKIVPEDKPPFVFQEHDPEFTADGLPRGRGGRADPRGAGAFLPREHRR